MSKVRIEDISIYDRLSFVRLIDLSNKRMNYLEVTIIDKTVVFKCIYDAVTLFFTQFFFLIIIKLPCMS